MPNRHRASLLAAAVFGAVLTFSAAAPSLAAQSTIRVVVNGEPITSNEISTRARFLRLVDRNSTGASLERAATEELVEEHLKLQEAKRVGVEVSQAQVEAAFGSIAQRLKITPAQLTQGLSQQGIDPGTLKTRLRTQILWQQLVVGRFSKSINISDSQIVDALEKKEAGKDKPKGGGTTAEYNLQQVVVIVKAKGDDPAAREREAEALRARVDGCKDLVATARSVRGTVVKPLGKRTEDELPDSFRAELAKLPVGRLSKPSRSPIGWEMAIACSKRDIGGDFAIRSEVEQELRNQEGEVAARRYMNDLRRIAVIEYKR